MPKGPNGEKRPADAVGLAVLVGRIATGEVEDVAPDDGKNKAAQALGRKGGSARAQKLTDDERSRIAKIAASRRWQDMGADFKKMLEWEKELTASDAQQDTNGAKMPFLRFTKGNLIGDHTTWFRDVFFDNLPWQALSDGEEASVQINVEITGQKLGARNMRIDHKPGRAKNNRAPTTHLHYDPKTRSELEARTDLVGLTVKLTRQPSLGYTLSVG